MMAARSKRERAVRRDEKAEGNRVRKNAQRTGKQRGGMAVSTHPAGPPATQSGTSTVSHHG